MEVAKIFALITLGAALIFFVKGVLEVNSKPDEFQFKHFIGENVNRLYLLVFGLVVTGLILILDPGGLTEISQSLPIPLQLGSPLAVGSALAGMVLMLPRKSPPAIEP